MWILVWIGSLPAAFCGDEVATDSKWILEKEADGVRLYRSEREGATAFRAIGRIDASFSRVVGAIRDTQRRPEWVPRLEEAKVIRQIAKAEWIEYWHLGTPFVVKDRELLIRIKVQYQTEHRRLLVTFSSVDDAGAPGTSYVRAIASGYYAVEPIDADHSQFTYEASIDFGGTVPRWMIALVQEQYPIDTVSGLRRQVARSDVLDDPKACLLLSGKLKLEDAL